MPDRAPSPVSAFNCLVIASTTVSAAVVTITVSSSPSRTVSWARRRATFVATLLRGPGDGRRVLDRPHLRRGDLGAVAEVAADPERDGVALPFERDGRGGGRIQHELVPDRFAVVVEGELADPGRVGPGLEHGQVERPRRLAGGLHGTAAAGRRGRGRHPGRFEQATVGLTFDGDTGGGKFGLRQRDGQGRVIEFRRDRRHGGPPGGGVWLTSRAGGTQQAGFGTDRV